MGVFTRHDTAFKLAELTGWPPSGIFYLLGGMWETILCSVVIVFLLVCKRDVWTDLGVYAMAVGVVESVMVWGCKLALTSPPPPGMTNCRHVTGLPIGEAITAVEVMILFSLLAWWIFKR